MEAADIAKRQEFRNRAEECVKLAQTVRTRQERTMLLHIAETWLRLADDEWTDATEGRAAR